MSRDLPTGFAAETEEPVFRPAALVQLDWPGGTVYAWTGYGNISWVGETFVGTGHHGAISPISESSDLRANGVVLELSGIPVEYRAEALANDAQGRPGKIWRAVMNAAGTAFEVDPYLIFDGVIDVTPIKIGPDTFSIAVHLEKELIDRRTKERRYTHEDQQIEYPGDLYFEFVAGLANKEMSWGGKTVASGAVAPGSSGSSAASQAARMVV